MSFWSVPFSRTPDHWWMPFCRQWVHCLCIVCFFRLSLWESIYVVVSSASHYFLFNCNVTHSVIWCPIISIIIIPSILRFVVITPNRCHNDHVQWDVLTFTFWKFPNVNDINEHLCSAYLANRPIKMHQDNELPYLVDVCIRLTVCCLPFSESAEPLFLCQGSAILSTYIVSLTSSR